MRHKYKSHFPVLMVPEARLACHRLSIVENDFARTAGTQAGGERSGQTAQITGVRGVRIYVHGLIGASIFLAVLSACNSAKTGVEPQTKPGGKAAHADNVKAAAAEALKANDLLKQSKWDEAIPHL